MPLQRLLPTFAVLALALPCFAAADAAPVDPPKVTEALKSPLPLPYDETADAKRQLAEALNRAKSDGKLVLADFGGNWCPDCRILAGTLALGEVKPVVDQNFETVMIDVGRLTKNLDIAARYGVTVTAVPTIIILDGDGRRINGGNPAALSDARSMSPQAIVDTIFGWTAGAR